MNDTTQHRTRARTWSVEILLSEGDGQTWAQARLHTDDPTSLVGSGTARLNPKDRDVPEIGDELAVARALSQLSHRLLDAAVGDIEAVTHAPASVED
jgi:uncharacterized protein DUF1876